MKLSGTYHLSTTAAAVLILTALTLIPATGTAQTVLTGIDVLEANGFEQLQGKRIGLVTNPTGVDRYLNSTIDVLHSAPGVELVALFGPEHGVRGNAHAGEHVEGQATPAPAFPFSPSTARPASPPRSSSRASTPSSTTYRTSAAAPTPTSAPWAM